MQEAEEFARGNGWGLSYVSVKECVCAFKRKWMGLELCECKMCVCICVCVYKSVCVSLQEKMYGA